MKELEKIKEKLEEDGYTPIETYAAQPGEEDPDHSHDFDTYILMIEGEMLVRMEGEEKILNAQDDVFIPKGVTHYSKVGDTGCTFLHAERH